eukprot:TRINITY_DN15363_c0_g4_i1.p1 TRINITY_DN15363_c0_g4~~TRINITY_DN15363_c0_g4_i1.p1  ORF type:complete len:604 (-),score=83.61 TRINITY_DN15363_c0_g4_i1:161-1972(-)
MGNRASHCFGSSRRNRSRSGRFESNPSLQGSIIPGEDPIIGSIVRRVVHDELGRDFEFSSKVLGTGYSGVVRLAKHKKSKQEVAVKQFSKHRLKPHQLELLRNEVDVYLRVDHPNVCRLLYAYEGKNDVWLVMELCGSELYAKLCDKKVYSEADAADVMQQMFQAVNYLHSRRVIHRDLKLENWLLSASENDRDDRLKLIDFGFSRILANVDETLTLPCGTLHYTSPEVLARSYTSKCDVWSLGVICYMLLIGRPPFRGAKDANIAKAIMFQDFPRPDQFRALSLNAQHFIENLLKKDPAARSDAMQALSHPWLAEGGQLRNSSSEVVIRVDVLKNLRQFAQGSHLRRAALTLLAYTLTSKELEDLEQTFFSFDRSGRGTITMEQFADVIRDLCKASNCEELSTREMTMIFDSMDVSGDEEVHYTPFIAAMLATQIMHHEGKIRTTFNAFDHDGKGHITADSLVQIYNRLQPGGLSREQAERWIREVDNKGNGVIDYDAFLDALMGKKLWGPLNLDIDAPTVRVFESDGAARRPRATTEDDSIFCCATSSRIRHYLVDAMLEDDRRASSFPTDGGLQDVTRARTVWERTGRVPVSGVQEGYFN